MKNFIKMITRVFSFKKLDTLRRILKRKNAQIRLEREKYVAEKAINSILTSYIFYLAGKCGVIRIPKSEISSALGKYSVTAFSDGNDYVIEVCTCAADGEGDERGKAGRIRTVV